MRQKLVAGNWKLNGSRESIKALAESIVQGTSGEVNPGDAASGATEVLVCPSYVHIAEVHSLLDGSVVKLGAQNCSLQESGAFTGQVSATMLAEYGCEYIIVGHSERRQISGETDQMVGLKTRAVQACGLTPIVCVGETLQERESDATYEVIDRQIMAVIEQTGVAALASAVIAYEPVWAIGTGATATPEQAQQVHAHLRKKIQSLDADIAAGLRILYGGSVKPGNAAELFAEADIDGGLIGGAALDGAGFVEICKAASKS